MSDNPTINDGGPAFPSENPPFYSGASLRDVFAWQALPECLRSMSESVDAGVNCKGVHEIPEQVATDAYMIADAMLAARERRPA